ncbi:TPA: hypothetical protein QB527_002253 [Pasteurella multocida]|uniref:hypothetical protein n=2 Tax=Pasteurella multocida TaxID=747 RepID=UPI002A52D124|nr:hypothetical protein [Pasteurella multocida]MDY0506166.1 hypothetical protein [Pasteurella multocida]MEB3475774.1 hypothetical protein [Pasteurella multocida]HDR1505901.1 hypothetical protein [Pasteurella multocida]HDR1586430.1 hypothetical protein [Pasteurella multocida]HDR1694330.1 hypothetical protein [Pasteurella multocida]
MDTLTDQEQLLIDVASEALLLDIFARALAFSTLPVETRYEKMQQIRAMPFAERCEYLTDLLKDVYSMGFDTARMGKCN